MSPKQILWMLRVPVSPIMLSSRAQTYARYVNFYLPLSICQDIPSPSYCLGLGFQISPALAAASRVNLCNVLPHLDL